MTTTRMFRDRVVSLEQTQEIGEKHLPLLAELVSEALPGFALAEHFLDHEPDLFCLLLRNAETGATRRVSFTRMFLSDGERLQAVVRDPASPMRARVIECIRSQREREEIAVTLRALLSEEERQEAEAIDGEWRRKNEAILAARRAEEERRERERERKAREEEERRRAQRERERAEKEAAGQPAPGGGRSRRRRRRGRGGSAPAAAQPSAPQPPQPQAVSQSNPPQQAASQPGGGGGRRRRRRRRGRGSGGGLQGAPGSGAASGNS